MHDRRISDFVQVGLRDCKPKNVNNRHLVQTQTKSQGHHVKMLVIFYASFALPRYSH